MIPWENPQDKEMLLGESIDTHPFYEWRWSARKLYYKQKGSKFWHNAGCDSSAWHKEHVQWISDRTAALLVPSDIPGDTARMLEQVEAISKLTSIQEMRALLEVKL